MTHKPRSFQLDDMIADEMPAFRAAGVPAETFDTGVEIRVTVASSRKDQSGGREVHVARSAIAAECLLHNLPRARNLYMVRPGGTLTRIHFDR